MKDFSKEAVKVFKALADPTRYRIIKLLVKKGEMGCVDFDRAFSYSKSAMSHHYRILENANLISARKEGQHVQFAINRETLDRYLPDFAKAHLNPEDDD